MPRGEPRRIVNFRLSDRGRDYLAELATFHDVDLSSVLRACLVVAKTHEPELKHLIEQTKEQA